MRDEDKSREQLLKELRELRQRLRAQKADALSHQAESDRTRDTLTADLSQFARDLKASRAETAAGKEDLAESQKSLRVSEQNLEAFHERYNILGDLIPFGIWTADAEGNITFLSDAFLEMSGMNTREISRLEWVDQLAKPMVKNAISEWSSAVHQRDIWEREFTAVSEAGKKYEILIRGVPILDAEENILSWLGINLDISQRKLAEERLRRHKEELEQANRAKDQFLANMSHEIRTPMNGVLGLTEILLHHELPAKVQDDLTMIRSSAESVMTLINDLFDLSRISQGKFDFHADEFDLRSMVRASVSPFEFQARSKDLEFSVAIDESVPSQILCDKDRLGQVIKNLVSNAIKFTERGFVRVHVNAEKYDEDTIRLNFTVTDSGMGIPKNKLNEVFSAFTQLDPSYSKKFAGIGLGLAISKSLVEGMGGEISVDSTTGKGATFRFYVTCGIVTEEQEPTAPSLTLNDLPPMTILLVEDNAVNRLFLRRALVTAGNSVGEAENGSHALAKHKETSFDLVLMDIQMPEMDGIEATRRIRSGKHGRADVPIIALTAYALKGDREKFLDEGMNGYVTKPVDFGKLARTIAEVCGFPVEKD
ncbi:MAG: response regulator [Desulfovibrionales bacterium]